MLKLAGHNGYYRRCWQLNDGMASDAELGDTTNVRACATARR
jgi:hypothetical protein